MTTTVKARFADGVLTPLETIDLPEGTVVMLNIEVTYVPEREAHASRAGTLNGLDQDGPTIDVNDPKALKQLLHERDVERYFRVLRQDEERAQANDCP